MKKKERIDPHPFWLGGYNYTAELRRKPKREVKPIQNNSYVNKLPSYLNTQDGRSGAGAPMRTKAGQLRSTVYGNHEIRFAETLVEMNISFSLGCKIMKVFRRQFSIIFVMLLTKSSNFSIIQSSVNSK